MKFNLPLLLLLAFVFVFFVGCGDPKVTGKVTFTDGTPLTLGQVMFYSDKCTASADIRKDGYYSAGTLKDGDGIPPGKYQVYIAGANKLVEPPPNMGNKISPVFPMPQSLLDSKYNSPVTSGLEVDVKGRTTFNITVEPRPETGNAGNAKKK